MNKRVLRSVVFLGMIASLLSVGTAGLRAGELSYTQKLPEQSFKIRMLEGYSMVSFEGAAYDAEPGYPLTPFMVKRYLLPSGTRLKNMEISVLEEESIDVERPLYPAQPPRPLGARNLDFVGPLEEIYTSQTPVTEFGAEVLYEGLLSGERVVTVALRPMRYTPAQGRLEVAQVMRVTLEYENDPSGISPRLTPGQERRVAKKLERLVENPEVYSPDNLFQSTSATSYRHVIVTTPELHSKFQELADWNTSRGVRDTVINVGDIASNFPGRDLAEQIRNFVITAYQEWGLEYLLLGADEGLIPTRDCFVTIAGGGSLDTIPTDMYFGCLDGDWDANGNDVFGEMYDEVDMYAEVTVGRACVRDVPEADLFTGKVWVYQDNPPQDDGFNLLLPSEVLWPDLGYSGDATNDAIADLAHPGTQISKLYQTLGNLSSRALEDSLNAGVGLVHHCAHGNQVAISCGGTSFHNSQARQLKNAGELPVYVSIACLVGAFDFPMPGGCLVEGFGWAKQGGTVAWLGNSRYGWGTPPSRGPSECIDVSFFEEVYGHGSPEIGPSLSAAKEENLWWGSYDFGRWSLYELNLHGDPAMPVHSRKPSEFMVDLDEVVEGYQTLDVRVSSKAGYPVDGMLVCARQNSGVYAWDYTDASGTASLEFSPTQGIIKLLVTGANHYPWDADDILVGKRQAEISFSPDTTWIDAEIEPLSKTFTIFNSGTDTLFLYNLSPAAEWIDSVYPTQGTLMPDESLQVSLWVDTTGVEDYIYLGGVGILSNDPERTKATYPVKLIKGDWPDIETDPDTVVFDMPAGDSLSHDVGVSNQGRARLIISSARSPQRWVEDVSPEIFELDVGESRPVTVTIDTTGMGYGTFDGHVIFATNDPDEEERKLPILLVMGEPDITLTPDTLHFSYTYGKEEESKTVDTLTVKNEGNRILNVSGLEPSRPWIVVSEPTRFELDPGDSRDLRVSIVTKGLDPGVYNAYIRVESDDPDEPVAKEPVKVVINQAPAKIACTPEPAVMDRATMKGSFWIRNDGMLLLEVSSITTETPWIVGIYPSTFSLKGHDSLSVVMIGDSTKVPPDEDQGLLTISSNDSANPLLDHRVELKYLGMNEAIPDVFELAKVAPNPVSGQCLISYAVPDQAQVSLALYDVTGQRVRSFTSGITRPGYHSVVWQGEDDAGRRLSQGVYILRMDSPTYRSSQKLILLR